MQQPQHHSLFNGWNGLGQGERNLPGGLGATGHAASARPMTAPDAFGNPFGLHPADMHQQHHSGGGHDPVLFAPVPHRGRNFSLPGGSDLLSLPDEPSSHHQHTSSAGRPSTSGGLSSSHSTTHTNLPPTLAAMPGYAYGAAMLAESNARKVHEQQQQQPHFNPSLHPASSAAALGASASSQPDYPFAFNAVPPGSADGDASSSRPSTASRPDTGQSYTSISTVGPSEAQIGTTTIGADGRVYQFIGVTTQHKKRARRKYDEIERMYACNFPGCTKSYGCLNHLNAHVMTQKHGPKRLPAEFKEMRKEWRSKKKAEEAAKKAEEEERKAQGLHSPEPEPGPTIPPTAATVLTSGPQTSQLLCRPLTGPGQVPGRASFVHGYPVNAPPPSAAPQDPSSLFAFNPPPLTAQPQHLLANNHSGSMSYMQPSAFGGSPYEASSTSLSMRPQTAPSQYAMHPALSGQHLPHSDAAAAFAASANTLSHSRPSSSSMFSFQAPDAADAVQSFGSVAGPSPVSPATSGAHHSMSPVHNNPAGSASLADVGRRFSLPNQHGLHLGGLGGIPEDATADFHAAPQEAVDTSSATTPTWMDAAGPGSNIATSKADAGSSWRDPSAPAHHLQAHQHTQEQNGSGDASTPNSAWLDSVTRPHSASPHQPPNVF